MECLNCKTSSENSESRSPKNETLEDDSSYVKTTVGPQQIGENSSPAKVLGMCWDTDTDQFYFDFLELIHYASSLPMTKRSVLKLTGRVFDPLGFPSPVMITVTHKGQCNKKWFAANKKDRTANKKDRMQTKKIGCKQKRQCKQK